MNDGPRITSEDIERNILAEHFINAGEAAAALGQPETKGLYLLTICVLVLQNGFKVVGTSACVSMDNYDKALGEKIARENAVDQVWGFMGYDLAQSLHEASAPGQRAAGERQPEGHDAVGTGPSQSLLDTHLGLDVLDPMTSPASHDDPFAGDDT